METPLVPGQGVKISLAPLSNGKNIKRMYHR